MATVWAMPARIRTFTKLFSLWTSTPVRRPTSSMTRPGTSRAEPSPATACPATLDPTINLWPGWSGPFCSTPTSSPNSTSSGDSGTGQVTKLTMGEKWEGFALVSAKDPANPNDYFLFVGNDNDFLTSAGQMIGPDGTMVSYNAFNGYPANRVPAPVDSPYNENDTRILVFRVTINTAFTRRAAWPSERVGDGSAGFEQHRHAGVRPRICNQRPIFCRPWRCRKLHRARPAARSISWTAAAPLPMASLPRSADGRFICVPGYNGIPGEGRASPVLRHDGSPHSRRPRSLQARLTLRAQRPC